MHKRLEAALSVTVTLAAIIVAGTYVYNSFFRASESSRSLKPSLEREWRSLLPAARWIGDPQAPIVIVEFSDYQCPFCQLFHESVKALRTERGSQVALAVIDLPLAMHAHAVEAAVAASCAGRQDSFAQAADVLFEKQDSLGRLEWTSLAEAAGVENLTTFNACFAAADRDSLKAAASARAQTFNVTGTPTILINGWRYSVNPPLDSLRAAVDRILRDGSPR